MDLAWDRETRLSRMLTIIFLLGIFPVLFFYIGARFEQIVEVSDGESLAADYSPAFPSLYGQMNPDSADQMISNMQ